MDKNSKILITGAAGFIGSNMVHFLNKMGYENLYLVDDLTNGHKFKNLRGAKFMDYFDKDHFPWIMVNKFDCIIHLGACSSTTEWDGKKMMQINHELTRLLIDNASLYKTKLIYASSASVYGNEKGGKTNPLNVYAFSKLINDQFVTKMQSNLGGAIMGLRFFNVYGPREDHKEDQASPVHKFYHDLKKNKEIKLFEVDAKRDFIYVEDVCKVIFHFMKNNYMGVCDVGTGISRSFDDVAEILIKELDLVKKRKETIKKTLNKDCDVSPKWFYKKIPFPPHLKGHYQYFTQANLRNLRHTGYKDDLLSLEDGIKKFLEEVN